MPVLVVRHAVALPRSAWAGEDSARPLNERGRRQADGLVEVLSGFPVTRFVSSPTVRCVDTLAPAAAALGLAVGESEALAEGGGEQAAALVHSLLGHPGHTVLCTHGDVIAGLLAHLDGNGAQLGDDRSQKGSVWVLERDARSRIVGRYLTPPA